MARIRTIKPEIWDSEKLGKLSLLARLTFIGLISIADDEGRGRGELSFLLARLHPYAKNLTLADLKKTLNDLHMTHIAEFYSVEGCTYYILPNFTTEQKIDRPSKSKLPPPYSTNVRRVFGELSEKARCRIKYQGSSIKYQGSRIVSEPAEGFDEFWKEYPRKLKKPVAVRFWNKINPDAKLRKKIMLALTEQKASKDWGEAHGKYIPHPTTWLNQERWNDELTPMRGRSDGATPKKDKYGKV